MNSDQSNIKIRKFLKQVDVTSQREIEHVVIKAVEMGKLQWNYTFANKQESLMNQLTSKTCVACRVGAPLVTEEEINEFMLHLPNWEIVTVDQVKQLKRIFLFNSFSDAVAFTQKVATLADDENHHPAILTEWGKVTVFWWSHKIKGLHVNDFIMAAKTDKLGKLYD